MRLALRLWIVWLLCTLGTALVLLAQSKPYKPPPKDAVRIGQDDGRWICAAYRHGWSCKMAADVRLWILENDPEVDPE